MVLLATSSWKGHPSRDEKGAHLAQELPPNGAPGSVACPHEHSFNITHPPTLVHIYIRCIQIYTESRAVRGCHTAHPAAHMPLGPDSVETVSSLGPGAGGSC